METRNSTFRSLSNYKQQHADNAMKKGVQAKFMSARTLTMARGILFGFKSKRGNRSNERA